MPEHNSSTNVVKIALSDHYLVSAELKFKKPPQNTDLFGLDITDNFVMKPFWKI